jgi:hypothetical protein
MLAQYLEFLPSDRDVNNDITIDVSNYDYCLIQPIGGLVDPIESSIDSGAIQGVSDGSAISATNFVAVAALNVSTGNTYITSISSGEIGKLNVVGRYVRMGMGNATTKLLVMLAKIS